MPIMKGKSELWPGPPCSVAKGSKITQLVYLTAAPPNSMPRSRGDSGFGSAGTPQIVWAQCPDPMSGEVSIRSQERD